ncbi:MAG TPA: dienelactone hydrolase family protein [Puia sp.]|nr:dienelactone hydrolase family protein [Puia sp.]
MHKKNTIAAGKTLRAGGKALIMIHGRGGTAEDILSLADSLEAEEFALLAPQATGNTWYPYSFLAPPAQNEPWLSSALNVLDELVKEVTAQGVPHENIYFLGFSQGACLMLEYITRNAEKWGGAVAFTGGLIGDRICPEKYKGDFKGTPVFIGTSDPDPHVPVERVDATAELLKNMHASLTKKIYRNMGHTISQDEIGMANKLVFGVPSPV